MDELLGALAGIGMLLLIGALFCRFLREMGWMRRETGRLVSRITGMTLGVGAAYWLLGALIHWTLFGSLTSVAAVRQVFIGPYIQGMFDALIWRAGGIGPINGIFAFCGRALGTLLFGQYALGGMALAFLLTDGAACLLCMGLTGLWEERDAERAVFLLLCLPGGVFLFLPGWAPMLLFVVSVWVLVLGKQLGRAGRFLPVATYDVLLCLSAFFSALVTACAALGRIG